MADFAEPQPILSDYFAKIVQGECNEVYFNCRTAANFMQKLCKVSAMKFTSIAEPQPILCKDKVFLLKKALLFLQT